MAAILNILIESEVLFVAVLGCVLTCYYKTLKTCLVSRCTKIKICCLKIERTPLSDETCPDILSTD